MCVHACNVQESKIGLDSVLESSVDAQEWRLEVERVLPSLKIQIKQDDRVRRHTGSISWHIPCSFCKLVRTFTAHFRW